MVDYRPVSRDDIDEIVTEFDRTWGGWGQAAGTPTSMLLSRHFTLHYLVPTTRGQVARNEQGDFLGVTLSRVVGQEVLFPDAQDMLDQVNDELNSTDLGRRSLADTERWHRIEEEMEESIGINDTTQAEIELFLVAGAARGHGVGGGLWRRQMKYFADSGVERYYLHTDSSCDVSFYDYHGLTRVAERLTRDHPEDIEASGTNGALDDIFIYMDAVRGGEDF